MCNFIANIYILYILVTKVVIYVMKLILILYKVYTNNSYIIIEQYTQCSKDEISYKLFMYANIKNMKKFYKSPSNLRLRLMITSVTASNTNCIFVVSVAHVKCV